MSTPRRFACRSRWLAAVVVLGLGGGGLNGGTNALTNDLNPGGRGSALNLLGIFFGFGALFIPFLIGTLLGWAGLVPILTLAAVLGLVPFILFASSAFPRPKQPQGFPIREAKRIAGDPLLWVCAFILFFQSGNEFTLGGWISTYLHEEFGLAPPAAALVLAGYWAAVMAGRLAASRLVKRTGHNPLVLGSAVLSLAAAILLLAAPSGGAVTPSRWWIPPGGSSPRATSRSSMPRLRWPWRYGRNASARLFPPAWRSQYERRQDRQTKQGVTHRKDPGLDFEKQQVVQPLGDEITLIPSLSGKLAQVVLPRCQGAFGTEQRLGHHRQNCRQVQTAEPDIPDPFPAGQDSSKRQAEAQDHKCRVAGVEHEHCVGGEAIGELHGRASVSRDWNQGRITIGERGPRRKARRGLIACLHYSLLSRL